MSGLEDQERLHELLQEILIPDGEVLTTWTIAFEAQGAATYFGYFHGPQGIPPWRSRGLHSQAIAYMDAEIVHAELHSCEDEPEDPDAER